MDLRYGEKGVGLQTSPLIVGRTLYAYTPTQKVIALDAATGALRWKFDAGVTSTQPVRGLTWWSNGSENGAGGRLFAGIANFLYALDPATGSRSRALAKTAASISGKICAGTIASNPSR